jgi:hypothetical protein
MTHSPFLQKPVHLLLDWGTPLHFVRRSGELLVQRGSVWVTRTGDLDDYVVEAGGRVVIRRGDAVLVQPWRRGENVQVAWRASSQTWASDVARRVAVSTGAWVSKLAGRLAHGLRRAAHAVAAIGQRAAAAPAAPVAFIERGPRVA